jgi:hypothetical protein
VVCGEDAGDGVAGEAGLEVGEGGGDSGVDAGGACGVGRGEEGETVAEAGCVLLRDGEDSVAALGAAGTADEMRAATGCGGGEGGGYDLDQVSGHLFLGWCRCPEGYAGHGLDQYRGRG